MAGLHPILFRIFFTHTHTNTNSQINTHTLTYTEWHTHTYTFASTSTHTGKYPHAHSDTHIHMHSHTHTLTLIHRHKHRHISFKNRFWQSVGLVLWVRDLSSRISHFGHGMGYGKMFLSCKSDKLNLILRVQSGRENHSKESSFTMTYAYNHTCTPWYMRTITHEHHDTMHTVTYAHCDTCIPSYMHTMIHAHIETSKPWHMNNHTHIYTYNNNINNNLQWSQNTTCFLVTIIKTCDYVLLIHQLHQVYESALPSSTVVVWFTRENKVGGTLQLSSYQHNFRPV